MKRPIASGSVIRSALWIIWIILVLCTVPSAETSVIKDTKTYEGMEYCIECHEKEGKIKKFSDGDSLSVFVDPDVFNKSVHSSFECTKCHKEFKNRKHPERTFSSKFQYRVKASLGCRECHTAEVIKSRAVHDMILENETAGEAIICTNCHSAHAVVKINTGNVKTSEEKYCQSCHAYNNQMVFKNGEFISLLVRADEIRNSQHRNVSCSDCHFGYSSEEHPRRRFRSEREYRISSSEICRRCHFDKYSKMSESIHFSMINVGRLDAPTCIDCHGGHAVESPGGDRLAVVSKCKACHDNVYKTYASSVHGNALINKHNKDVPICIDCHMSHNIKDPLLVEFHNQIPDMCSNCHSDEAIMGKYGLSTKVVKTYLTDFHGLTLSLYQMEAKKSNRSDRPIAVCTDCHGTHDIIRISGTDMHVIRKNLLKRCQVCHSDATENFPEAWLSHHEPSLRFSTMVYLVEKFYMIMLPLIAVGLLFQILLQIWRYLMNR